MKFYDFDLFAPNPWIVRIFAEEKGIVLERHVIDLFTRENRREPFLSTLNPMGELPVLQLDNGRCITEVVPICEYLEETHPTPALIGSNAWERAETRMWVRRIDQNIAFPMGEGFSMDEGREFFLSDYEQVGVKLTKAMLPEGSGAALKAKSRSKLIWLDGRMGRQPWICGERFSLADIYLYCFLQFGENHGQPIPPDCKWAQDFFRRMKARPTAWQGEPVTLD